MIQLCSIIPYEPVPPIAMMSSTQSGSQLNLTALTDADLHAIYVYLRTIPAVRSTARQNSFIFQQRWALLSASPFPLGVDGYFYPVQLRALLDHGALAYPSSP